MPVTGLFRTKRRVDRKGSGTGMTDSGSGDRGMRKAAKQIILCAMALALFCVVCRLVFFNQFSVYVPLSGSEVESGGLEELQLQVDHPEVLRTGEAGLREGYAQIPILPQSRGVTELTVGTEADAGREHTLRVGRFRTVYDRSTGNFTGDTAVLIAVTLFWLLVSAIMVWHFFQAKGTAFYDYSTIYYAGFSLFSLATGLVMLSVTVSHLAHPENYSMFAAYTAISSASIRYMVLTTPVMLLFAAAVAVSNIALLRHEHPRLQNVLGLLVSVLLVVGEGIGWLLFSRNALPVEWQGRLDRTLQNTYATVFIYCQCMLTGSVICGILAARHVPAADKDFIIILGCWFNSDGSLPPLLRGRVDKALDFWHMQREKTGKEACFVPSGGRGCNEPEPEAEAIRQYLLSRGVEDRIILPEDRSKNTWENMCYSGRLIRETGREGKAAFATSSYHVFRSGLWARQAGLPAEGIGSRTRWWFWPNAFMRETAGLMQKRWKQEVFFLLLLVAFFGVLSVLLW